MPYVEVAHHWLYNHDAHFVVESHKHKKSSGLGDGHILIRFGYDEDAASSAALGAVSLDQAEQLARQIMEVVVDARLGKFTGFR
jgi:hypothetical protein